MKKSLFLVFILGILGLTSLQANEKSGIFVGADIGFAVNASRESVKVQTADSSFSGDSIGASFNLSYGLRAGYQQYFGDYNGLRLYGNFNYLHFGDDSMMKYGANLDYLLNFSSSDSPWGFFVGIGYEWMGGVSKDILDRRKKQLYPSEKIVTNGLLMNVGFSKIYNNHHRIEFGAKIPFYTYDDLDTAELKIFKRTFTTLYFAYSYSF